MTIRFEVPTLSTLAACLALSCATPDASAAEAVKLRYTYPSEAVVYRFTMKTENETSGGIFGATPAKGGMATVSLCQLKKIGAEGDAAKVELVYTAMKFRQDIPRGKSIYFDTSAQEFRDTKPEDLDPMARMMLAFIEKPLVLTVDPRGHITKVENLKSIRDAIKEVGIADQLGQASIESIVSEEQIKGMFRELFAVLPEEPAKLGSTWSATTTMSPPIIGPLKLSTAWTYAADEKLGNRPVAHLKGAQTMQTVPKKDQPAGANPTGAEVELDPTDSKGVYDMIFDPQTGLVQSSWYASAMPAHVTFKSSATANQSLSMKMEIKASGAAALVADGAPLDPDNVITKPDAEATKRTPSVKLRPNAEPAKKD